MSGEDGIRMNSLPPSLNWSQNCPIPSRPSTLTRIKWWVQSKVRSFVTNQNGWEYLPNLYYYIIVNEQTFLSPG